MKTEDQIWDEALDDVRNNWACGYLSEPGSKKHCALGALGSAVLGERLVLQQQSVMPTRLWHIAWQEIDVIEHPVTGPMVKKLAQCLLELHPHLSHEMHAHNEAWSDADVVISVNDGDDPRKAQASIIEAMEKARAL